MYLLRVERQSTNQQKKVFKKKSNRQKVLSNGLSNKKVNITCRGRVRTRTNLCQRAKTLKVNSRIYTLSKQERDLQGNKVTR